MINDCSFCEVILSPADEPQSPLAQLKGKSDHLRDPSFTIACHSRGPMISIIPTELFWLAGAFIMLMAFLLAATAE